MPKRNHARAKSTAAAGWKVVYRQKQVLVIDLSGQTVRILYRPVRLKGKPGYKVAPDCDPAMW